MVGCLYIPDFAAWVHHFKHPAWRKIAVHQRGEVIARTHALAQAGLEIGEPLERAAVRFPDARIFARDYPMEQAVWENVVQRVHDTTPFLYPVKHGLVFFRPHNFREACDLSAVLEGKVGLGPNRTVARIAAQRSAPGSVLRVKQGVVNRFLSSTRTGVLLGLGFDDDLVDRLELFGLTSLEDVTRLSLRHLDAQFGPPGAALFEFLHPGKREETVPLYTPPPAITEVFEVDGAPLEWLPLGHILERLSFRAARRLGGRLCKRVTVELRSNKPDSHRMALRIFRDSTSSPKEIHRAADWLLKQIVEQSQDVDELVLSLGSLRNPCLRQASLFMERPSSVSAIQVIEERFPGALRRARVVNPDAPFHEDAVRFSPLSSQLESP